MNPNNISANTTNPIQIAQLNAQLRKHVVVQLLNHFGHGLNIILLQKPDWGFIGRNPDRNIQILDVTQPGHPTTTIINIYNDTAKGKECILNQLQQTNTNLPQHPTIITGDFNLHHPLWSREDHKYHDNQLTENIVDWLLSEGYSLVNKQGKITHLAQHNGKRPSVIDLSFVNSKARNQNTIKNWAIQPLLSLDSDHNTIQFKFTIDHGLTEIKNICGLRYRFKDVDPSEWINAFEEEAENSSTVLSKLASINSLTPNQLDLYAETLTQTIHAATSRMAKERKNKPNSKVG
ncbi:Endonuclease/exonuclease/phosphatase [Crassisporium funariophilum]|nr:Endonuclease/exonuclease/phosphatase [Crassisporium funariophilum]